MRSTYILLFAVAMLQVIPTACSKRSLDSGGAAGGTPVSSKAGECSPSLRFVGPSDGVYVESEADGCVFFPILIGCSSDLDSITEAEEGRIIELLTKVVAADKEKAGAAHREAGYVAELSTQVNSELGRSVSTKVLLSDFFYWEKNLRTPDSG